VAIELSDLIEIMTRINKIPVQNRKRLLFIGDTHFYVDCKDLVQIAHILGMNILDSTGSMSSTKFGYMCGFSHTDTLGLEGECSIIFNLMSPLPSEFELQFDLVIDAGVLFWTFNPGTALSNLSQMVSENGQIVHITALSGHFGAAYYNVHPKLFIDFYKLNEFALLGGGKCRNRRTSILSMVLPKINAITRSTHKQSDYRQFDIANPNDLGMVLSSRISRILIKCRLKRLTLPGRSTGIFCFQKIKLTNTVKFPLLLETEIQ
jgi:hypothetical protein